MKIIISIAIASGLMLAFVGSSFAQNAVGEGVQKGAALPGEGMKSAGSGMENAGKAIQPETGNKAADIAASVPGKVVEGTGIVVGKTGEVLKGATDSVTGPAVTKEAKANLNAAIDCKTAKKDITVLEKEKRSVLDRTKNGAQSLFPISAAVRLLSGNYTEGAKVATGSYNKDLEAKIEKIKTTCDVG